VASYSDYFDLIDSVSAFFLAGVVIVKVVSAGRNSTPSTGMVKVTRTLAEVAWSGTWVASTEAT